MNLVRAPEMLWMRVLSLIIHEFFLSLSLSLSLFLFFSFLFSLFVSCLCTINVYKVIMTKKKKKREETTNLIWKVWLLCTTDFTSFSSMNITVSSRLKIRQQQQQQQLKRKINCDRHIDVSLASVHFLSFLQTHTHTRLYVTPIKIQCEQHTK